MKERTLVVRRDKVREVIEALVNMGLQVSVAGHLPRTDLIIRHHEEDLVYKNAVPQKVLLRVRGDVTRRQLKAIPGVVRVRSRTMPRRGPVIARV